MIFCFLQFPYVSGVLILHLCRSVDFNIKYFILKVNIGMNEMRFKGIMQAFQASPLYDFNSQVYVQLGNFTVFKVRIFVLSHQNKDQKLLSKTHLIHTFKFDLISNCFQGPLSLIPLGVFQRPGVWDCLQPALKHPRLWINT